MGLITDTELPTLIAMSRRSHNNNITLASDWSASARAGFWLVTAVMTITRCHPSQLQNTVERWLNCELYLPCCHCYLYSDPISISWENLLNGLTSARITVYLLVIHFQSIYFKHHFLDTLTQSTTLQFSSSLSHYSLLKSGHVTILLRLCLERRESWKIVCFLSKF